jgi:hypothetical protein
MFRINLDPPVQQPINVLANNIFVSNQARNLTKLKLQERSSQPTWQWFSFCRHYVMHGHHSSIIQFTPTTKVYQLELLMDGINHVHIFSCSPAASSHAASNGAAATDAGRGDSTWQMIISPG